jgi:hypothetical protein
MDSSKYQLGTSPCPSGSGLPDPKSFTILPKIHSEFLTWFSLSIMLNHGLLFDAKELDKKNSAC